LKGEDLGCRKIKMPAAKRPNAYFESGVFDSVVVVAFQIVFRAEIHVNDIFLFFKNYF
jgi:hypothetical protein